MYFEPPRRRLRLPRRHAAALPLVTLGVGVAVRVGVIVGVLVGVAVDVLVAVGVFVGVLVGVAVAVGESRAADAEPGLTTS